MTRCGGPGHPLWGPGSPLSSWGEPESTSGSRFLAAVSSESSGRPLVEPSLSPGLDREGAREPRCVGVPRGSSQGLPEVRCPAWGEKGVDAEERRGAARTGSNRARDANPGHRRRCCFRNLEPRAPRPTPTGRRRSQEGGEGSWSRGGGTELRILPAPGSRPESDSQASLQVWNPSAQPGPPTPICSRPLDPRERRAAHFQGRPQPPRPPLPWSFSLGPAHSPPPPGSFSPAGPAQGPIPPGSRSFS
uniref:basic proline-rich protein-like n=1 Tax=Ictidomys tridecemlineatus TaxID=43179 RepID=UPI001A9E7AD1|nr:basic proline-rich protein-like [Ictidomys tridecemlineatus]